MTSEKSYVAGENYTNTPLQTAQYEAQQADTNEGRIMRTRRKKEFSIIFLLRHSQRRDEKSRPLLIRLRVNGETTSDYSSGVYVRPEKWDQHTQKLKGRTPLVALANERLTEIEAQHREILRELKRRYEKGEGKRPTAALLKAEFVRPGSTSPNLIGWYKTYLNYLDSLCGTEDGRAEKTLASAYKTLDYLIQFENPGFKRGGKQKSLFLFDLTTGWGKRFHAWLQIHPETGKRRMQKDSANRHLSHFRDAINHAIDEGFLSTNVLDKFRPKRGKGKPVYFLEPEHIERLMGIRTNDEQLSCVLWWVKLMCFTGLDYIDAKRYAKDPQSFHRTNAVGLKIVIERQKPPCNTCEIPLLGQVREQITALFLEYPAGPAAPNLADINRHLKVIQPLIGFEKTLTSKICRKSAGALFLREGFAISTVSKALGHSSIRVTEEHYVKMTTSATDYDMERVARQQASGTIKLRPNVVQLPFIHKAS